MRIFLVLICSLALACVAGAQEEKKPNKQAPKKKPAQAGQVSQPPGHAAGKPTTTGKPATTGKPTGVGKAKATGKPAEVSKATGAGKAKPTAKPAEVSKAAGAGKAKATAKPAEVSKAAGAGQPTHAGKPAGKGKPTETGKPAAVGKATRAGKPVAAGGAAVTKVKPQHFNLANKPKPAVAPPVKFQQSRRIEGAQNWTGPRYAAFRNYSSQWHDRNWWRGHSNRVVFVFGGWYAWNAGYWYPAWGYDPNAYYPYDGPIYAYNNLPPDQVIANVQATLQQQGYYHGEVDGLLGPLTRGAIADYQRANGLAETAAIDQPTLERLGMA
jgi:hypothetical protein